MSTSQIRLYYKNVMADVLGREHGITKDQLEDIAQKTSHIIQQLNEKRKVGQTPYRDLPYNEQMVEKAKSLSAEVRDGCEYLVVLGIGGSVLGNIALQTALNHHKDSFLDT